VSSIVQERIGLKSILGGMLLIERLAACGSKA